MYGFVAAVRLPLTLELNRRKPSQLYGMKNLQVELERNAE